jgi:hypothetical protein
MKITFLPKTRLGKWTVGMNIFTIATFIFFYIFAELLKVITSDLIISIFGATAVVAAIIAFFTGGVAVIKKKDQSVLIFLAILTGFVVLAFMIGDMSGLLDD